MTQTGKGNCTPALEKSPVGQNTDITPRLIPCKYLSHADGVNLKFWQEDQGFKTESCIWWRGGNVPCCRGLNKKKKKNPRDLSAAWALNLSSLVDHGGNDAGVRGPIKHLWTAIRRDRRVRAAEEEQDKKGGGEEAQAHKYN